MLNFEVEKGECFHSTFHEPVGILLTPTLLHKCVEERE
jgi:hypothetical protein